MRVFHGPRSGPVTAGAILAFAPDLRAFSSGRNFAAWLGLVPRQRSTGGKTRPGGVSEMGQTDIRKPLIVGAMSRIRWNRPQWQPSGQLARAPRRAQSAHDRGRHPGQQDGQQHLGDDDQGTGLPDGVSRCLSVS